jgi:diaminohydroxyphosphoribosylaminopyrimidine deaminase/5-amino-6-(5-phosphoribosylamino)uracil reductase
MGDPFPQVSGTGIQQLQKAGVTVEVGLLEGEARKLNAPYLALLTKKRPFVHAKWAMTLDGKIATRTGQSQWISGEESRCIVHELRGRMDAIIVGMGTVRADNPLLTARPPGPRTPSRIILSSTGELPQNCRLLQSRAEAPVIIATTEPSARKAEVQAQGCEVIALPTVRAGSVSDGSPVVRTGSVSDGHGDPSLTLPARWANRPSIAALLAELGQRRFTNVLVEGGAEVLGSFRDAGLIDEVHCFIAPKLIGGATAMSPMSGLGAAGVAEGLAIAEWICEPSGGDWYVRGRV